MPPLLIYVSLLVTIVMGHERYEDDIPNGHNVPNPCPGGGTWGAVGHTHPDSGHGTNQFGHDFKHRGDKHWNTDLCQHDSDGDGKTNGEELGDPHCTWRQHQTPSGKATGHPGICEPLGSPVCSHQHSVC